MRVLFLNQTFYPDVAATAQHASDLAAHLVERGHDVAVLCSRCAYDNPAEMYPANEVWRGVQIRRIASSRFGKASRWRRALDFGSFIANCAAHLAMLPRFDLVIAMTSPPLISYIGSLFSTFSGSSLVFWVMDLNPDEAIAAGWLRRDSRTAAGLSAMLNFSLRRSASVIVLDRFMAARIEAKGIDPEKIVTLPPWSHDHVVSYDTGGRDDFRAQHGLAGKFVVMYSGNHSPCHPLTTLLDAARALNARDDIAFCFVGGGSEFQTVREYAERHELRNVTMLPYQPLEQLSASLSAADLHTVVMGEPFVGLVHPCKVYNIRRLGIPYLYIGPVESHVSDLRPRFSAAHGDVASVIRHIEVAASPQANRPEDVEPRISMQKSALDRLSSVLEQSALAPHLMRRGAAVAADKSGRI